MALSMISNLLLVSISLVISHYLFQIQNEAITNSFLYFPNSENRHVITKFGHQLAIDPDLSHLSSLTAKNNDSYSNKIFFALVFCLSFIPFLVGSLLIYFFAHDFKTVATKTTMSISTLYLPFTYLALSMEAITCEYVSVLYSTNTYDFLYEKAENYLDNASQILSNGMWNNSCNVNLYFKSKNYENIIFLNSYFNGLKIVRTKSLFELLLLNELPFSIDLLLASLKQFISLHSNSEYLNQDERFLSLLYYFTNFSDMNRNKPYFNIVESNVETILDERTSYAIIVTIIVIIIQIIACIFINLSLVKRVAKSKNHSDFIKTYHLKFFHKITTQ